MSIARVVGAGAAGAWGAGLDRLAGGGAARPEAVAVGPGRSLRAALWDGDVRSAWPGAPERVARMDRACRLSLLAARDAFASAGLLGADLGVSAVAVGSRFGCLPTNEAWQRDLCERGVRLASPLTFSYTVASAPSGEVSIAFGMRGPNLTLSAGDASGLAALHQAVRWVESGRARRVLAGAYEVLDRWGVRELWDRGWRDRPGDDFPAEAAAFLVIESSDLAAERGAPAAPIEVSAVSFDPEATEPASGDGVPGAGWTFSASVPLVLARAFRAGCPAEASVGVGPHRGAACLGEPRAARAPQAALAHAGDGRRS